MKLKTEYRPTASLIPYARNARMHSEAQVSQIAASIREFGFTNPVLIDKDGTIIAGHGRVLAAQKLELEELPCIVLGHLNDIQRRAYVLADNRLALNASWDEQMLALELSGLEGFDLKLLGFTDGELRDLVGDANFAPGSAEDQSRLDQRAPVTCPHCGHEFQPTY